MLSLEIDPISFKLLIERQRSQLLRIFTKPIVLDILLLHLLCPSPVFLSNADHFVNKVEGLSVNEQNESLESQADVGIEKRWSEE